ncbi:MAG: hypothetical protein A2289_06565 [Deltaproteobacteria bacterium RIFOXYA12_FULL_58_15]|nr:MAG: hypothetical protein A2289_06565 [Deltaproteobacteria bacterium RIFOXYA12_FULL_58_15]
MVSRAISILTLLVIVAAIACLAQPMLHRQITGVMQQARVAQLSVGSSSASHGLQIGQRELSSRIHHLQPLLASWRSVGGCGVGGGGASSSAGGVKWVGRSVSGGLVGFECMSSATVLDGGHAFVINTRPSADLFDKWTVGANAPFLYKVQEVDVFGEKKTAKIPGWGDVSFDVTRKLGLTNSSRLTLSVALPSGSYDAVRQGVVLPQVAQLGAGKVSGSLTFEHTFDKIWGLILVGGNVGYGGGENSIGDYRSPSGSAYAYTGYLLGPFVPSVGLSLAAKTERDRERREVLDHQSLYTANLSLGLEWSSDYVAFLLAGSTGLSPDNGLESWTVALGATTSLF